MEIQACRKESDFRVGFMDPMIINERTVQDYPKDIEDNIYKFLVQQHFKHYILLPYNFK